GRGELVLPARARTARQRRVDPPAALSGRVYGCSVSSRRQREPAAHQPGDELLMRGLSLVIGSLLLVAATWRVAPAVGRAAIAPADAFEGNDSHFHLTDDVQQGNGSHHFQR